MVSDEGSWREKARRDGCDFQAVVGCDPPGAGVWAGGNGFRELAPAVDQAHSIVRGQASGQDALAHEPLVGGFALRFSVVVRAVAAGKKAESILQRAQGPKGVGDPGFIPTKGAGAQAAPDGALLIGFSQKGVQAVRSPKLEHVEGVAATDIDDVLGQHTLSQVVACPAKEAEAARLTREFCEALVETLHIDSRITGRGRHEADPGPLFARELQNELVEGRWLAGSFSSCREESCRERLRGHPHPGSIWAGMNSASWKRETPLLAPSESVVTRSTVFCMSTLTVGPTSAGYLVKAGSKR